MATSSFFKNLELNKEAAEELIKMMEEGFTVNKNEDLKCEEADIEEIGKKFKLRKKGEIAIEENDELDVIKELKKFKSISVYPKNDIEIFLQEKSIRFEKSCVSTTHLIFDDNIEEMLGYFTIANRSLILSKEELNVLSKTQQKKLSNSGSILRNGDLMTSSFLLGQLGKNYSDDILKKITGKDLLTSAYNLLLKIKELINTKYVWLECQNESRLINFYRDFGFKLLEHIISDEGLKVMIMELK